MIDAFSPPFEWTVKFFNADMRFRAIHFQRGDSHTYTVSVHSATDDKWVPYAYVIVPPGENEYAYFEQWRQRETGYVPADRS